MAIAALLSRAYLPTSGLPAQISPGAEQASEQLIALQRLAAQPRPYRFSLRRVE